MLGCLAVPKTLEIKGEIRTNIIWCGPLDPQPDSPPEMFVLKFFYSPILAPTNYSENPHCLVGPPKLMPFGLPNVFVEQPPRLLHNSGAH